MNQDTQKVLAVLVESYQQHLNQNRYEEALEMAKLAHRLEADSLAHLLSISFACIQLCRYQEGKAYIDQALQYAPDDLEVLDVAAHLYGSAQEWEKAGEYGYKALMLRHNDVMSRVSPLSLPPQVHRGQKRVIAFSLFGKLAKYIEPAVLNTEVAGHVYPDWVCRFYIDDSVPEEAVVRLQRNGAEIVRVNDELKHWPGTMWRFLAINDPEVSHVIFRDADSVVSVREAAAVSEWIQSGKAFHTMRDSGSHTTLVLAGMWGCLGGAIPDIRHKIQNFINQGLHSLHFADQNFLSEVLWPTICQSLYAHDRLFHFGDSKPFPVWAAYHHEYQIGLNEARSTFHAELTYPEGSRGEWLLYSRISPVLNIDGSPIELPQERLVCRYEATVWQGKISDTIPYRYGVGLSQGLSRLVVQAI